MFSQLIIIIIFLLVGHRGSAPNEKRIEFTWRNLTWYVLKYWSIMPMIQWFIWKMRALLCCENNCSSCNLGSKRWKLQADLIFLYLFEWLLWLATDGWRLHLLFLFFFFTVVSVEKYIITDKVYSFGNISDAYVYNVSVDWCGENV